MSKKDTSQLVIVYIDQRAESEWALLKRVRK